MGHFSSKVVPLQQQPEPSSPHEYLEQEVLSPELQHDVIIPPAPSRRNFLGQSYETDEDADMVEFVALLSVTGLPEFLPESQDSRPSISQPMFSATKEAQPQAGQPNFSRPIQPRSSQIPRPIYNSQASSSELPEAPFRCRRESTKGVRLISSTPDLTATSASRTAYCYSITTPCQNLRRSKEDDPTGTTRPDEQPISPETAPTITTRECIVCLEDQPLDSFPRVTSRCRHLSTTCLDCLREWIGTELNAMTWDKLQCPAQGCNATLKHRSISRLATKPVFERYDRLATLSLLSTLPNFHWCLSPTCSSGQIHAGGPSSDPIFTCTSCAHRSCIVHQIPWHTDLTCREYDYASDPSLKRKEDKASEKAVQELSRRCPGKGCNAPIIKNGGCDHMTCQKCLWEFCWLCRADYKEIRRKGNVAHVRSCQLHTKNLRYASDPTGGGL